MKKMMIYMAKLFSDCTGDPSAKRYACAVFIITGIVLAFCGYNTELVGIFVAAALGENIASVFEKGGNHDKE